MSDGWMAEAGPDPAASAREMEHRAERTRALAGLDADLDVVDRAFAVENKWHAQRYGTKAGFVERGSKAARTGPLGDRSVSAQTNLRRMSLPTKNGGVIPPRGGLAPGSRIGSPRPSFRHADRYCVNRR